MLEKKVRPGDRLRGLSAELMNGMLEVLDWFRSGRDRDVAAAESPLGVAGQFVIVRNNTAGTLSFGDVVGLGDLVIKPTNDDERDNLENGMFVFQAEEPAWPDHCGKFAILVGDLEAGEIGKAIVGGMRKCQVDFAHADLPYADVTDGDPTILTAREFGGARILSKETGTGTKWAVVELGKLWLPRIQGVLTEDLAYEDVAEFEVYEQNGGGGFTDTGRQAEIWGDALSSGQVLHIGDFVFADPNPISGLIGLFQSRECAGA